MKKTIIKIFIILGSLILIALIIFCIINYYNIKISKLEKQNENIINNSIILMAKYEKDFANKSKELEKLKAENKILTRKQLEKIPCEEKDNIILSLQDDKKYLIGLSSFLLLSNQEIMGQWKFTSNQLNKSNEMLKRLTKRNEIDFYIMSGVSNLNNYLTTNKINIDFIVGVDYTRYFFNTLGLSIGGYVKVYDNIGIGAKLGLGYKW